MAEGIYNPRVILKALDIERAYTKEHGDEDGLAPNLVFFKIIDKNIVDTIYVPRNEFKNYVPEENVYYLDRTRDSGDDITDYNLEPVGKLYDLWFPIEESVCKKLNRLINEALNESIFKAPTLEQFLDICNKANIQIDLEETDNKVDKVNYPIDVDIYTVDYETCILDSYSYKQLLNKLVDTLKLELGDYIGDSIDKDYLLKCMGEEPYCLTEVIDKLNENRLDYNRIYKFEYITEVQGEQTKYTIIKMLDL